MSNPAALKEIRSSSPTLRGSQIAALRFWFAIPFNVAALLAHLFNAEGSPVSRFHLAREFGMSLIGVKTRISELRRAMHCEAIDTQAGGYALTEIGRAECIEAFEAMAADLRQEKSA